MEVFMLISTIMNWEWTSESEKYPIGLMKYAQLKSYDPVFDFEFRSLR